MGLQMKVDIRNCPVCDNSEGEENYSQMFIKLPGLSADFKQVISVCSNCGMTYVSDFLTDEELEFYYSAMSTYEYAENEYEFPEEHRKRSEQQHKYVSKFSKGCFDNVLDIGCSLGYTLSLFQQDGSSVLGIEPSSKLKEIAKLQYGVDVITDFFNKDLKLPNKYDLILLSHVAEHLKFPKEIFTSIKDELQPGGLVYVEVPSIELFDERDLFQFSFEHINYFSHGSLLNLMHVAGFEEVDHIVFENSDRTAPFYPTLGTLWRKATREYPLINRYEHDRAVIIRYINLVKKHAGKLNSKIEKIVSKHSAIAIWGAGTLTAQLFAQTLLKDSNIKVIYDSDPKKDGQLMNGIPVKKPELSSTLLVDDGIDAVVIGSWSSQDDIYRHLVEYCDPDKIFKLFINA
jgi:SAM-dependent methyltransferase